MLTIQIITLLSITTTAAGYRQLFTRDEKRYVLNHISEELSVGSHNNLLLKTIIETMMKSNIYNVFNWYDGSGLRHVMKSSRGNRLKQQLLQLTNRAVRHTGLFMKYFPYKVRSTEKQWKNDNYVIERLAINIWRLEISWCKSILLYSLCYDLSK
jgi:hypothetical protein